MTTKCTYHLSDEAAAIVTRLVEERHIAPSPDILVEQAIFELARRIRDADDTLLWQQAVTNAEFQAECAEIDAAFAADDLERRRSIESMDRRIQSGIEAFRNKYSEVESAFARAERDPSFREELERDPEGAITRRWDAKVWQAVVYFVDRDDPLKGQVHAMIREALEELESVRKS